MKWCSTGIKNWSLPNQVTYVWMNRDSGKGMIAELESRRKGISKQKIPLKTWILVLAHKMASLALYSAFSYKYVCRTSGSKLHVDTWIVEQANQVVSNLGALIRKTAVVVVQRVSKRALHLSTWQLFLVARVRLTVQLDIKMLFLSRTAINICRQYWDNFSTTPLKTDATVKNILSLRYSSNIFFI